MTPELAVDLPYLNTTDRDAAAAFAGRLATAERVPLEHPDQLAFGADFRTAAGGLAYTWPTLVRVCTDLVAGAADVVLSLAGRRRSYDPKPHVAAAVYNTFVREQFDRLGRQQLLVGSDDRLIYQLAAIGHRACRSHPGRAGEVLAAVFAAGDDGGLSFCRAFGPVGRVDASFTAGPPVAGLALPAAPAVVVRPYATDGRLRVRPAVKVGDAVLDGRLEGDEGGRTYYHTSWVEPATEWAASLAPRLAAALPVLAETPLPGRHPEETIPPLVRWLKGWGVVRPVATAMARRLTTGQFAGGSTPEFGDAVRLGAPAEWTAADLLLAIADTVGRHPGRTPPILALSRVGFALAVGDVTPLAV